MAPQNICLTSVKLGSNHFTAAGISHLASSERHADFSAETSHPLALGPACPRSLRLHLLSSLCCPDLVGNNTLDTLDLVGCALGDAGAANMASILENNPSIRRMHLASNNISWLGGR